MKKFRAFVNENPIIPLVFLTLGLNFACPHPICLFFSGMSWGYGILSWTTFYAERKRWKRIEKKMGTENYVLERIFEANKDDLYKYRIMHFMERSRWN